MDDDIKRFIQIVTSWGDMKITSNYTTKELVDAIEHFSDDEIIALSAPRPGHPEMRGFIFNPRILQEQLPEVSFAMMRRLEKANNKSVKDKKN